MIYIYGKAIKGIHFQYRGVQGTPMPKTSMAKSSNSKSKPHHFLSCFGFSGKFRRFKSTKPAAAHKNRPFSWIKLHFKPRPSLSPDQKRLKPGSDPPALRSVAPAPARKQSNEDFALMLPAATDQSGKERPEEVRNNIIKEKIILETVKHSNSPKTSADQSQSRFSLTRKLESLRSGRLTQPASPSVKEVQKSTTISHSFSFPTPNPPPSEPVRGTVGSTRVGLTNNDKMSKNYGPVAGMSILIITLAIMVLWGKLYAILCTATWIYLVTSLRSIVEEDDNAVDFIDSDSCSQVLKKKLLFFKGFLYRNREKSC